MTDPQTHLVPIDGSGLTPCCARPPTELPTTDRITMDDGLVTCTVVEDRRRAAAEDAAMDSEMDRMAQERRERREEADAAAFASIPTYGVRDGGSTSQGVFIHPDAARHAEAVKGLRYPEACDRPPLGWTCSRGRGHDGPCNALENGPDHPECPQPCVHLSQEDAREGRRCAQHPCICDDRVVRRGQGTFIVGWHDDAEDTVVVSVWGTQEDAERDLAELTAEGWRDLIVEGWHGRDRAVLS